MFISVILTFNNANFPFKLYLYKTNSKLQVLSDGNRLQ